MAKKYVQSLTQSQAGSGNIIGATSITLQSLTDIYGNAITSITAFGDKGYATAEPDTTNEEAFTFTSVTVNANTTVTLGGVSSVLAQFPYTETSGMVRQHSGGTKVVITDNVAFWATFANKNNNEIILGDWQVSAPATSASVVPKFYVDSGVLAGGADASLTVKGITRLTVNPSVTIGNPTISIASPAVVTLSAHGITVNDSVTFSTTGALPTGITAGTTYYVISAGLGANVFEISGSLGGVAINTSGTQSGTHTLVKTTPIALSPQDPKVPTANQVLAAAGDDTSIPVGSGNLFITQTGQQKRAETTATTTGSANAYVLTLSPVPTSLPASFECEAILNFTNTGTATLNINTLGAKAIQINGSALIGGELLNGTTHKFKYDGTAFQLLSPSALTLYTTKQLITTAAVTASNTNVETTLLTVSVPGGTLGTNNGIRGKLAVTLANTSGSADNLSFRIKYGSTTIATVTVVTTTVSLNTLSEGYIDFLLLANAATNAQKGSLVLNIGSGIQYVAAGTQLVLQGQLGTAAEDSTAAKTLAITAQWATAQAGATITMDHGEMDIIK